MACLEKAQMTFDEIDAIAITYGPGLIGSLLVGVEAGFCEYQSEMKQQLLFLHIHF